MIEFNKAKEMLDKWKQHDLDNGFYKGVPDYPTNTRFVKEINELITKEIDRITLNVLHGKQTRINAKEILVSVVSGFLNGTEYEVNEVLDIMGVSI